VKRFRPSGRRLLSFAAAAAAGAAATLFVATPAFAHHATVNGDKVCDHATGQWTVTWTITNSQDFSAVLTTVTVDPQGSAITSSSIASGVTLPKSSNGPLVGTQIFPGTETSATLTLNLVTWSNGVQKTHIQEPTQTKTINLGENGCTQDPKVTFKDNCDGTVTVTLDNPQGSPPVTVTVNGTPQTVPGGQKVDVTVAAGTGKFLVQIPGKDATEHMWQQPRTCTPTPSPSSSLPTTGGSLSAPLAVGGVLLAGGIGMVALVFAMRRRRSLAG
jgi:hypothetical protein